jgi:hypothetical protein
MSSEHRPTDKLPLKERLKVLFEEYGGVAIGIFGALWVLTLAGIWVAIELGWEPKSTAEKATTFGAAYVVFRLTLPLRILATAVLTPIVARLLERLGLRRRRT